MHLQRVQVPDFRVLKDVDITFEKDFNPRVFPLGSQNGGGKSTLLQLIFVLLHCSASHDRHFAIKNLLNNFTLREDEDKRVLAIIDVWDGIKSVTLEFFVCNDSYIKETLSFDYLNKFRGLIDNSVTASLSYLSKIKNRKSELLQCQNELQDFDF
jgi:predicted ATP-binding protein involved in virulence